MNREQKEALVLTCAQQLTQVGKEHLLSDPIRNKEYGDFVKMLLANQSPGVEAASRDIFGEVCVTLGLCLGLGIADSNSMVERLGGWEKSIAAMKAGNIEAFMEAAKQ